MMDKSVIEFDYSKLKGRIVEKFDLGGAEELAEKIGTKYRTLLSKLRNERHFTQTEIFKISEILEIDNVNDYFFKVKC